MLKQINQFNQSEQSFHLADEEATFQFGRDVAGLIPFEKNFTFIIHLEGDLGAGKTTFTRSILRALGFGGNVKSPTYTIVESYLLPEKTIYHFDLYRLADPEELEMMGIRDYLSPIQGQSVLCLIEWPSKGLGILPEPDLTITLEHITTPEQVISPQLFTMSETRQIILRAHSEVANQLINALKQDS